MVQKVILLLSAMVAVNCQKYHNYETDRSRNTQTESPDIINFLKKVQGGGNGRTTDYSRPEPERVVDQYNDTPEPYNFKYNFVDEYGNQQYREETSDTNGNVQGKYGYTDSNGIYRQVEYTANAYGSQYQIQTNEPGTKTSQPADVIINSDAPETDYHQNSGQGNAYRRTSGSGATGFQRNQQTSGVAAGTDYRRNPGQANAYRGASGSGVAGFQRNQQTSGVVAGTDYRRNSGQGNTYRGTSESGANGFQRNQQTSGLAANGYSGGNANQRHQY